MSRHPAVRVAVGPAVVSQMPKPKSMDHRAIWFMFMLVSGGRRVQLTGGHASGKWSAPVRDVVDYYARLIRNHELDFLTATEGQQRGLVKALQSRLGKQYAVRKAGNYLCIIDRRVFKWTPLVPARQIRLTRTKNMPDWRNLFLGIFRIRCLQLPDVPIVVNVGHAPASIESGDNYRRANPKAVETHKNGMAAWGRWLDRRARTTVAITTGDGNADLRRAAWRARFNRDLGRGLVWNYSNTRNTRGSLGRRLIDFALIRTGGPR